MACNTERDYKKDYEEFWKGIVENAKGNLIKDQIKRELSDYKMVIENCASAYSDMTNGNISKPNTHYCHVKAYFEEFFLDKGIVQDDVIDMINQCQDIDELKKSLKEYFEID